MNSLSASWSFDLLALFTPAMLGTAFGTFFVVFVLLTAVLIYHWRTYALLHHTHLVAAEWWFLIISALLFGAASVFLVLYSWWR